MEPALGLVGAEVAVRIVGSDFHPGTHVRFTGSGGIDLDEAFAAFLGDEPLLGIRYVDAMTLEARVPGTLAVGVHDLRVVDPSEREGVAQEAFEVVAVLPPDGGTDSGADAGADSGPDSGPISACNNGIDDDLDTAIDFPADPGCSDSSDSDETNDPPPETCSGDTPMPLTMTAVTGSTIGEGNDYSGSCGGARADVVYEISLPIDVVAIHVALDYPGTDYDTIAYLRDDCDSAMTEIICDDDGGYGQPSQFVSPALPAGVYFLFVDGQAGGASGVGDYEAHIAVLVGEGAGCGAAYPDYFRCAPELACMASAVPGQDTCQPAGCTVAATYVDTSFGLSFTHSSSTVGLPNLHAGTCGMGMDGGLRSPEAVIVMELTSTYAGGVEIRSDLGATNFDSLIYLRDACSGNAELACDDDGGAGLQSAISYNMPIGPGTYYIFVDAFGESVEGSYDLDVTLMP